MFPSNTKFHKSSFNSSVGRAEDCRSVVDILRSLVRIGLEGVFFFVFFLFDSSLFFLVLLETFLHACYLSKCRLAWDLVNSTSNSSICNVCPLISFSVCVSLIMIAQLIDPITVEVWV